MLAYVALSTNTNSTITPLNSRDFSPSLIDIV